MRALWQRLNVGDKVRIVRWPKELSADRMHRETLELYRYLIQSKRTLTIVRICKLGLPEGEISRTANGIKRHEFLLLNHSGLQVAGAKVKKTKKKSKWGRS
jgi:hypothetical protein